MPAVFRHVVGQALHDVSYSDINFFVKPISHHRLRHDKTVF